MAQLTGWKTGRDLVRGVARRLRHTPDRLLHRRRRQRALRRLERLHPRSVLFACRGNLCRSPYAALRLQRTLSDTRRGDISVSSAGFLAAGHHPPRNAVTAARWLGLDLSDHQSRRLSADLIRQADLVLVMDPEQRHAICSVHGRSAATTLLLGDFDPQPISTRIVVDPYGHPVEAFVECYRRIDRCIEALVRALGPASRRTGFVTAASPEPETSSPTR